MARRVETQDVGGPPPTAQDWVAELDAAIADVSDQLARQYDRQLVDQIMADISGQFSEARITQFLSILIMKAAAERLKSLGQWPTKETGASTSAGVRLDFLRFEFKYVLSARLREQIESDLPHFMVLDPFVAQQHDRNYIVRSLYYDDPAFTSYYQKIDGMLRRAKFRLRTYTSDPADACATYLEIKGRHNLLVFKRRAGFKDAATSQIFVDCPNTTAEILKTIDDSPVAEQFRYALTRKHITPVMLIDYVRRPYFSRYDSEFRLTLDSSLHATRTNRLFPQPWQNRRMLLPGSSVMEIKFKDRIPLWFHQLIKRHNLERRSISKVCKGVEAWNLVPQLN